MTEEMTAEYIRYLQEENARLHGMIEDGAVRKRTRRTDEERQAELERRITGKKSNGVQIARPADPIASYDHYRQLLDYFAMQRNGGRNQLMLTMGIGLGLRISDLCELRWMNFLDEDGKYRDRTYVIERKTGKINGLIITNAVKLAINTYRLERPGTIRPDDYILISQKSSSNDTQKPARESRTSFQNSLSMILLKAGKELGFEEKLSSHSLRKTFVSVVEANYASNYAMDRLTVVQSLLNHSDATTTMRYTGILEKEKDKARIAVSDWLLGKSNVNALDGVYVPDGLAEQSEVTNLIRMVVGEC